MEPIDASKNELCGWVPKSALTMTN